MVATAFIAPAQDSSHSFIAGPKLGRARRTTTNFAEELSTGPTRIFDAREHLFCEGDPATHVYLVEAGHVCIYRMMPDGRRQVIDFAYPGDMIGLGALGEHAANAQAIVKTWVRCVSIPTLHNVAAKDAKLGLELYEALSQELLAARQHLFTVSQCTASERVAGFLLALSRRNARRGEDPAEIVLPMTRTDIADFLGLTIERSAAHSHGSGPTA